MKPSLSEAVTNHLAAAAAETDASPQWWTPELEAEIGRFGTDAAFRESLSPTRRDLLNSRREAAIKKGLIQP